MVPPPPTFSMKIIGLQGIEDPASIRAEVERGGRFVFYTYCISVVFMSFKRASDIHFIRPGQSALVRGLPCTLVSLLFGWWGFPWGIIYTFEALIKNLGGGTDITEAILADLARAEPASTPATSASAPPDLPLRGDPPLRAPVARDTEPRAALGLGFLRLAALVVGLATAGWIGVAVYRGSAVQTAFVNGLDTPLTFTLDSTPHTLAPRASTLVTLAEGDHAFTWIRPDGRPETGAFTLATPFWSRPVHRTVAVFNPDRTALVYRETTRYFPTDQTIPEGNNDFDLHVGEAFYAFPATDYFFEDFPAQIKLNNRQVVAKSRYHHAETIDPSRRLLMLQDRAHARRLRTLALRLGELHPDNELIVGQALTRLTDKDTEAFFALHLGDRPLRVEWHRIYQHHIEYHYPDRDLRPHYRQLAAELPDEGAAAYLASRIETDSAARHAYLEKAITAAHPCPHAHSSLAYEALTTGRFPEALAHLRAAESSGMDSLSFRSTQREILLANGLRDESIGHLHRLAARDPNPLGATRLYYLNQEIATACQKSPSDPKAELSLLTPYLKSLKPIAAPETITLVTARLTAAAAYARGDEAAYLRELANDPDSSFNRAISAGDHAAAVAELAKLPSAPGCSWLLAYLAADQAGASSTAEDCYARALAAFAGESAEHRAIATRLQAGEIDPAPICAELISLNDKIVLTTALGHRFPSHRAAYHALAVRLNFKPEFPARFITRELSQGQKAAASSRTDSRSI